MDKERFILLATRFLSGEITEKENKELRRYLSDPLYNEQFQQIEEKWKSESEKLAFQEFSLGAGKKKFFKKLAKQEKSNTAYNTVDNEKTHHFFPFLRYAAVIVLALGSGFFLFNYVARDNSEQTLISNDWKEKSTLSGEKAQLTLQDGTIITLNVSSNIKYPSQFNDTIREVYLDGEAYFDVAHENKRPFVVRAGNLETMVLGTTFNVSAFPEDKIVNVSLLEGKVLVKNLSNTQQDTLQPMQQYSYETDRQTAVIKSFDPASVAGWRNNNFIFRGVPLREVAKVLSRQYGVKIRFKNKAIEKCEIRADFNNEPLWTVLDVLKYIANVDNEIILADGKIDTVILKGNGCN